MGKPTPNSVVTRRGGGFGAAHRLGNLTRLSGHERTSTQAFYAHGFRPPCAWYLNDNANIAYAHRAPNSGHLIRPVLFINGDLDPINTINGNHYGNSMRAACADLNVTGLSGAHWLPLERKEELVQAIRRWLQTKRLDAVSQK